MLDQFLLTFPSAYRTRIINYESLISHVGIQEILKSLNKVLDVDGDIIECGSGRCGTAVIISNYLKSRGIGKKVYALDTYGEGFDKKELKNERRLNLTTVKDSAFTRNSYDYVKSKIERLGVSDILVPIRGLFQDTLPHLNRRFCLSFIDCDLERTILYCAEAVWQSVSNNGILLFDDYLSHRFRGAKRAIDNFVNTHKTEISEYRLLNRLYYVRKDH
jgi:hypothetical protein